MFWAWIRKPDWRGIVFLFKYKPYEVEELPFSVNWIPVEVVFPLPVTEARVSASVVRQEAQVMVKDPPRETEPPPPSGAEVLMVRLELVNPALETVPKPKVVPAELTRRNWSAVPVMSATFAVELVALPTTERPADCRTSHWRPRCWQWW